jgi:exodeoxyribonuclease VII large subunit
VISSKSAAGYEDFIHTLETNPFGYKFQVQLYDTIVQGSENSPKVVQSILDIWHTHIPYDVVVIIRGGGAQTDFIIFDDYKIGQAIAKFPIPFITGIGHQKDETIADLMAHTAQKTPTKVAEYIIRHNRAFEESIINLQKLILIKAQQHLHNTQQRLTQTNNTIITKSRHILTTNKEKLVKTNQAVINTAQNIVYKQQTIIAQKANQIGAKSRQIVTRSKERLVMVNHTVINVARDIIFKHRNNLNNKANQITHKPKVIVSNKHTHLDNIEKSLNLAQKNFLKNQDTNLNHFALTIKMMSPDNILKKGFAILRVDGNVTSNPDKILVGQQLDVILEKTIIQTTVNKKIEKDDNN